MAMFIAMTCIGMSKTPVPVDLDGSEAEVVTFPAQTTNYDYAGLKREKLGRGLVAWRSDTNTVTVSWRYLSSDPRDIAFDLHRDGTPIATNLTTSTQFDYADTDAATSHTYTLYSNYSDGEKLAETKSYTTIGYIEIPLRTAPETETLPKEGVDYDRETTTPELNGLECSYFPSDCSIGDVDGDGEYELFLMWEPSVSGGHWRYTGDTFYECYKLDGTALWNNRVHFGHNIHSSKNCQIFTVGDFDNDGKAEVVIKTADGSEDGEGNLIGVSYSNPWRWCNTKGQVLEGPEYLTVFEGATGKALCTVDYIPDRGPSNTWKELWGDNIGNRSERYQLSGAYLDGTNLSIVACRGIYKRTGITAWDWDGKDLKLRWTFDTTNTLDQAGNSVDLTYFRGQGYHSMSVGDIDFDGNDEILYGSMTVDNDGNGLYTTRMGHGDSERVIQADPRKKGLQMFVCLESNPYGCALYDLEDGNIHWRKTASQDTGRAVAGDIDGSNEGCEMWASAGLGLFDQDGNSLIPWDPKKKYQGLSLSLLIWWTGELERAMLPGASIYTYSLEDKDHTLVTKFDGVKTLHSSLGHPSFVGDFLGDWREEVIFPTTDGTALRIYLSPISTQYRFWTFLEDPVYRHSLANECHCHNMGSMPGFYFGPDLKGHGIWFRGCYIE